MKTNSLLGLGRFMIPVPAIIGQRLLFGKERARLGSIRSEEHHLVHDFVTREIPRAGGPISIVVKTECAHCGQPLHIEIDSEMKCRVEEQGAAPWVFIADVDFSKLTEPSIVDVF